MTRISRCLTMAILAALIGLPALAQSTPPPAEPNPTPAQPGSAPAQPTPPPALPKATFSEALLVIEGKSETNGSIQLEFQPVGGAVKAISVNVIARMKASDIAEDIWKELSLAAGSNYKLKVKENSKISIKAAAKDVVPFSLEIKGQNATGISLLVKKD